MRRTEGKTRSVLRERLEARRAEIEEAALTRVKAISDPGEIADPAYAEGLRAAVRAAVAYGIETTGREGPDFPVPVALLAQARMAARVGIPLDTVLRRYFAGYSLLGYFILEEAAHSGLTDAAELKRLLGAHAGLFDRLLAAIGTEHRRESDTLDRSTDRRQAERIERLLAGELIDTSEIAYDFEGWHLGIVIEGAGAERRARDLATNLDCRLLCIPREDATAWAWLGARRRIGPEYVLDAVRTQSSNANISAIALGEPANHLPGWRLTHRQAAAALRVARRGSEKQVRYMDVALLATALLDDLLATSLRRLYLDPLETERDSGALRETLRAYLGAGGSLSGAATLLGVSRHTISNRLQRVECRIGRPVYAALADLDAALRLDELDAGASPELDNGASPE